MTGRAGLTARLVSPVVARKAKSDDSVDSRPPKRCSSSASAASSLSTVPSQSLFDGVADLVRAGVGQLLADRDQLRELLGTYRRHCFRELSRRTYDL